MSQAATQTTYIFKDAVLLAKYAKTHSQVKAAFKSPIKTQDGPGVYTHRDCYGGATCRREFSAPWRALTCKPFLSSLDT